MTQLSMDLFGLHFPSPFVVEAGAPGSRNAHEILQAAKAGAGAVVTEGSGPKGCIVPRPWLVYTRGGLLNSTSYSPLSQEQWFKELPKAKKAGIPIIFGINARGGIEAIQSTARGATKAGADILKCAASDPTTGAEIVKLICEVTNLPVVIKIGFHNNMERIGKPLENAGASGIIAIDAPWAMRINTETGKPAVGGLAGIGHFGGYPILPLAIYSIYVLARTITIPIIGGGGIRTGSDLAEMLMAGAQMGGACTTLILNGGLPRITEILSELTSVMHHHGCTDIQDLIGKTKHFLQKRQPKDLVTDPITPSINGDRCTACGDCAHSCGWNAIKIHDTARINPTHCVGCALCVSICPTHAISLDYWAPVPSDHKPIHWQETR